MANKKTHMKRQQKQNRSQKKHGRKQSHGRKQIMRGGGKFEIQWKDSDGKLTRTQQFDDFNAMEEKMKNQRKDYYSNFNESYSESSGDKIYTIQQIKFGQ